MMLDAESLSSPTDGVPARKITELAGPELDEARRAAQEADDRADRLTSLAFRGAPAPVPVPLQHLHAMPWTLGDPLYLGYITWNAAGGDIPLPSPEALVRQELALPFAHIIAYSVQECGGTAFGSTSYTAEFESKVLEGLNSFAAHDAVRAARWAAQRQMRERETGSLGPTSASSPGRFRGGDQQPPTPASIATTMVPQHEATPSAALDVGTFDAFGRRSPEMGSSIDVLPASHHPLTHPALTVSVPSPNGNVVSAPVEPPQQHAGPSSTRGEVLLPGTADFHSATLSVRKGSGVPQGDEGNEVPLPSVAAASLLQSQADISDAGTNSFHSSHMPRGPVSLAAQSVTCSTSLHPSTGRPTQQVQAATAMPYVRVASSTLRATHLVIFARADVAAHVTCTHTATQNTSFGGLTSKGGAAVALTLGFPGLDPPELELECSGVGAAVPPTPPPEGMGPRTRIRTAASGEPVRGVSLLFVGAHLAPHQKDVKGRNAGYVDIVRNLQVGSKGPFPSQARPKLFYAGAAKELSADGKSTGTHLRDASDEFDICMFGGDLNYRINGTKSSIEKIIHNHTELRAVLAANDQLTTERRLGRAFLGFMEGTLAFRPTYKYRARHAPADPEPSPASKSIEYTAPQTSRPDAPTARSRMHAHRGTLAPAAAGDVPPRPPHRASGTEQDLVHAVVADPDATHASGVFRKPRGNSPANTPTGGGSAHIGPSGPTASGAATGGGNPALEWMEEYETKKGRLASYCDRVLYKRHPEYRHDLTLLYYHDLTKVVMSDHRPVAALLRVGTPLETEVHAQIRAATKARDRGQLRPDGPLHRSNGGGVLSCCFGG